MAYSKNKVLLVGNLGRDPEVRHAQNGDMIVTLDIATTESWRDRNTGERKEKTEWHRVVIFNQAKAKLMEGYAQKGTKVDVEGTLRTRKWQDQQGKDHYSTEVTVENFRGNVEIVEGWKGQETPKASETRTVAPAKASKTRTKAKQAKPDELPPADLDDEIPF